MLKKDVFNLQTTAENILDNQGTQEFSLLAELSPPRDALQYIAHKPPACYSLSGSVNLVQKQYVVRPTTPCKEQLFHLQLIQYFGTPLLFADLLHLQFFPSLDPRFKCWEMLSKTNACM